MLYDGFFLTYVSFLVLLLKFKFNFGILECDIELVRIFILSKKRIDSSSESSIEESDKSLLAVSLISIQEYALF